MVSSTSSSSDSDSESNSSGGFNQNTGGAMFKPVTGSAIRKGNFVTIKNEPCKIIDISVSKTGKHGHAKVHITAIGIFNKKKYFENVPGHSHLESPYVVKEEVTLVSIDNDGIVSYMNEEGVTKEDLNLPNKDDFDFVEGL